MSDWSGGTRLGEMGITTEGATTDVLCSPVAARPVPIYLLHRRLAPVAVAHVIVVVVVVAALLIAFNISFY